MKIYYDPHSNTDVGDALIENFYLNNKDRTTWVHTGRSDIIYRAQLGLLRGEINGLTVRIFDYGEGPYDEKARYYIADQYGDFHPDVEGVDLWGFMEDHRLKWAIERAKLQLQLQLAKRQAKE